MQETHRAEACPKGGCHSFQMQDEIGDSNEWFIVGVK